MDVKLENLIEKLRIEGVEEARKEADRTLEKAKAEAKKILSDAEKKAEQITAEAEKQAAAFQQNAERAIRQAGRDAELKVKEELTALFDSVFKRETAEVLDKDFLPKLILKVVEQWQGKTGFEVKVAKKDLDGLEEMLVSALKKDMGKGITVEAGRQVENGFHIGIKGKDVYYDFSGESIASLLKSFLNKRLNEILEEKNG